MLADLVVWYFVFVFSTTFHEAAHAFVSYQGGDSTAYEGGQVSLDPVPHIRREPVGMVVIPLLSFFLTQMQFMIGWASAPFNPLWANRHPRRYALMSFAGPAANLLLALVAFIAIKVLMSQGVFLPASSPSLARMVQVPGEAGYASPLGALAMALSILLNLNVLLGLFNLMPLPPLDGAAIVEGAAPNSAGRLVAKLREVPMFGLLGLIIAWQVFPYIMSPAFHQVWSWLYGL